VLEVPTAEVISALGNLWEEVKKPVDLVVVFDRSGSMAGEKINSARSSLVQFIQQLSARDRLQVITFSSDQTTLTPLTELGSKRDDVVRRVSGIIEGGNTTLYDTALQAYNDLKQNGDPKHIRAVVVLTDGQDTVSINTLEDINKEINASAGEGGNAIKIFTIAFGDGADKEVLKKIAEPTGGKEYDSSPENIQKIYDDIATFF